MNEEFEIRELQSYFDFKGFLLKLVSHWPLFLLSLLIGLGIAYYVNVRKLPVYQIGNMISIKDDQNPFFTSNTSLTFNWGGTTDKVNTAIITLRSRTHNEQVVDRLGLYLQYLLQGEYQLEDAYGKIPFVVEVDTTQPQILNQLIKVTFTDSVNFTLELNPERSGNFPAQIYNASKERTTVRVEGKQVVSHKLGETIKTAFFTGVLLPNPEVKFRRNKPYFFRFKNFDQAVKQNLNIDVQPESRGSSIINLRMRGSNKAKLVDYLNTSVSVLSEDMLERKNLFATKTIRFIDSSLAEKSKELEVVEGELNEYRDKNSIVNLENEGQERVWGAGRPGWGGRCRAGPPRGFPK